MQELRRTLRMSILKALIFIFPGVDVEHTFACDALIDTKNQQGKLLKLIIEYKFDEDFQSKVMRAKVITQVLFYMKRFEQFKELYKKLADKMSPMVYELGFLGK